jgi:predicted DCC family thiol-disulfide oxidoreductase YuxK
MSERRSRPVLLYDGACRFCRRSVEWIRRRLPVAVDAEPFQQADLAAYGVTRAEAEHSVQWIEPSGRVSSGHVAVARLLIATGGAWALLGRLLLLPPFSWVAAVGYRLVSAVRKYLPT